MKDYNSISKEELQEELKILKVAEEKAWSDYLVFNIQQSINKAKRILNEKFP